MSTRSLVLLAASVLVLAVVLLWRSHAHEQAAPSQWADRFDELDGRLDELTRRLEMVEQRRPEPALLRESGVLRQEAAPPPAATPTDDPRAILARYIASFSDGEGSEYFRLLVEAYVKDLVDPICALLVEPERPLALRLQLARLLAKASLRGDARVIDALVAVLRQNGPQALALACVQAWQRVGDGGVAPRLEAVLWQISDPEVRQPALQALLRSLGDAANAAVLRLLASAPDEGAATLLLHALDGSDLDAALRALQQASRMQQPVRLAGAQRIGEFDDDSFRRYVDEWLQFETDARVRDALGGAKQRQSALAGWSAMQAVGPPNADPKRDDPKAWAPRDPEMGLQWLELRYARADRIAGVRIFEVNAPGAVCEVRARDASAQWHTLWSGTATATGPGPLVLTFAATAFVTDTLRVVLDTNRTSGWNEIDAVEIIGAGGAQFATSARASSSYAQQGTHAIAGNDQALELRQLNSRRR